MTFICLNIELRTQPLIVLVVIAGTDKERPGCSKIPIQEAFSGKFANLLANGWKKQLTKVETYF